MFETPASPTEGEGRSVLLQEGRSVDWCDSCFGEECVRDSCFFYRVEELFACDSSFHNEQG